MTHLSESVVFPGLNSCHKFCNFFWYLAVMWFCTDLALLFKNWEKRARESSETKVDCSRRLSAMMRLVDRICSWQILILARIQRVVALSMIVLKTGWLPGGLNRSDFGNQRFSNVRWVKLRWRWWASSLYVDFSIDLVNLRACRPAYWRIILKMLDARPGFIIKILNTVVPPT